MRVGLCFQCSWIEKKSKFNYYKTHRHRSYQYSFWLDIELQWAFDFVYQLYIEINKNGHLTFQNILLMSEKKPAKTFPDYIRY